MKLVAHRGASLERPENTLEGYLYAASLGAYAVEGDIRQTSDGEYVLFHDPDLRRLADSPARVSDLTFAEMEAVLAEHGRTLLTLDALCRGFAASPYAQTVRILFHIKLDHTDTRERRAFYRNLTYENSGIHAICGLQTPEEARVCREYFASEDILAFMPRPEDYAEFYAAGAGIIRLWEQWLDRVTPARVRAECPNADVFIMCYQKDLDMNGSPESLTKVAEMGADGALFNDIRMGIAWQKSFDENLDKLR